MFRTVMTFALVLIATAANAQDYCNSWEQKSIPHNLKPITVNVDIHILPRHTIHSMGCNASYRNVTACTYPTPSNPKTWIVLISDDVPSGAQFECVMEYEKAHMPPNYWGDPKVEKPDTIKWLKNMKINR